MGGLACHRIWNIGTKMIIKSSIMRNVTIGLISQLLTLFFSFITRTFFIRYLGIEILGISSTFTSLISTLSLTELGFQIAIINKLYKPLSEKNYEECNRLISIFKRIYLGLSFILILLMLCIVPFLGILLKNVEINEFIYKIYLLFGINIFISYNFASQRALLYADKNDYVAKSIDSIANIIFTVIKLIILVNFSDYTLYLFMTVIQGVVSNCFLYLFVKKKYRWIRKLNFDRLLFTDLIHDIKYIFFSKISGYIYSATDNIIISIMSGPLYVGLLANYTIITGSLKQLSDTVMSQIVPFIGRFYVIDDNIENKFNILKLYTFVRFCIAGIIVVPIYVLIDDFIVIWLGKSYILKQFALLLCFDLYITIVHTALCDFISIARLYKDEKNISIICASINLSLSIVLSIKFGMYGVLYGTCISQIFYWILRADVVFKKIFNNDKTKIIKYCTSNLKYIISIIFLIYTITMVKNTVIINNKIINFFTYGFLCEISFFLILFLLYSNTREFKYILKKINFK